MIRKTSLLEIIKEHILDEALPLHVAKEFSSTEREKYVEKRLNDVFNKLGKLPGAKKSKRGDRIYVPYEKSNETSSLEKEITKAISKEGYEIKDFLKGIVIDPYGREQKLGKVLTKLNLKDLLHDFNTGKDRASRKSEDIYLVFSKHPYDIGGISTDRDWKSCTTLNLDNPGRFEGDGGYKGTQELLICGIKAGIFVVYYVKESDLNINNPIGRVLVKPFVNTINQKEIYYTTADSQAYGNTPADFESNVEEILFKILKPSPGMYFVTDDELGWDYDMTLQPAFTILPSNYKTDTKEDIEKLLKYFNIKNYTVNDDLSVDVNGTVNILTKGLKKLPFKFGRVNNNFFCTGIGLETLENSPDSVNGHFYCNNNNLTSLEFGPKTIRGAYNCSNNKLESLNGAPYTVSRLDCDNNKLTNLEGAPKKIGPEECTELSIMDDVFNGFSCENNLLTSLKGLPDYICGVISFGKQKNGIIFTEKDVLSQTKTLGRYKVKKYEKQTN